MFALIELTKNPIKASKNEPSVARCSQSITYLPELPNCTYIDCENNKLTFLPELLMCQEVYCEKNKLTYIPNGLPNCGFFKCNDNKYIYINKKQANCFKIQETPNYNKFATIIQRNYKKHLRKRYHNIVNQFIFKGPSKIVCLYTV